MLYIYIYNLKKKWICNPYIFIFIDNSTIKALNIEETYIYIFAST